jgi:hypothetical protein
MVISGRIVSVHKWYCEDGLPHDAYFRSRHTVVAAYRDALKYASYWYKGRPCDIEMIIKYMSEAKGFPTRYTESACELFFMKKKKIHRSDNYELSEAA